MRRGNRRELFELAHRDNWNRQTNLPLNRLQVSTLAVVAERNRLPGSSGTTSSANAVDIGFRLVRQIEVEHVRDRIHINPASRHVSGDQDGRMARLEVSQGTLTGRLTLVTMQRQRGNSHTLELLRKTIRPMLRPAEHDRPLDWLVLQQSGQQTGLLLLENVIDRVADQFSRLLDGGNLNPLGIVQDPLGQFRNFLRHRGREEQGLLVFGQQLDDLANGGQEAHVEHPVRFVQDEDFHSSQVDETLLTQVFQPSRRCDQDVDSTLQSVNLWVLADSTDNDGMSQSGMATVSSQAVADLDRQLASGGQNQTANAAECSATILIRCGSSGWVLHQSVQHRQRKCSGLAGSGLCTTQKVASSHRSRYRSSLNRCRCFVSLSSDSTQNRLGEPNLSKSHLGPKVVVPGPNERGASCPRKKSLVLACPLAVRAKDQVQEV